MRWQDQVEDLLFDGETVESTVDVDSGKAVVTSHRVLAFTPELEGENFHQVDRPNVDGVDTGAKSEARLLEYVLRTGVIGGILVIAGLVLDFDAILGDVELDMEFAGKAGVGGMLEMAQTMLHLFSILDELMQLVGSLMVLVAVVIFGIYWYLRDPTLVITVAGEEGDIHLPRPAEGADEVARRLEHAILPRGDSSDGEGDGADESGDPLSDSASAVEPAGRERHTGNSAPLDPEDAEDLRDLIE